jgi:hypothetical protein
MPPHGWTTPDQLDFLIQEDSRWILAKNGDGTLKSFYTRTTDAFLSKWPGVPDEQTLKEAEGDLAKSQELVKDQIHKVCSMRPVQLPL